MKRVLMLAQAVALSLVAAAQDIELRPYKEMPAVMEESGDFILHYNMSAIMFAYNALPPDVRAQYNLPHWLVNKRIVASEKENPVLKQLLDKEIGSYLLLQGLAVVETKKMQQVHKLTARKGLGNPSINMRVSTPYTFFLPGTNTIIFSGLMNNTLKGKDGGATR